MSCDVSISVLADFDWTSWGVFGGPLSSDFSSDFSTLFSEGFGVDFGVEKGSTIVPKTSFLPVRCWYRFLVDLVKRIFGVGGLAQYRELNSGRREHV